MISKRAIWNKALIFRKMESMREWVLLRNTWEMFPVIMSLQLKKDQERKKRKIDEEEESSQSISKKPRIELTT